MAAFGLGASERSCPGRGGSCDRSAGALDWLFMECSYSCITAAVEQLQFLAFCLFVECGPGARLAPELVGLSAQLEASSRALRASCVLLSRIQWRATMSICFFPRWHRAVAVRALPQARLQRRRWRLLFGTARWRLAPRRKHAFSAASGGFFRQCSQEST